MIAHLSYVMCDKCGNPFPPGDDAREARVLASAQGVERVDGEDVCRNCQPLAAEAPR